MEYDHLPFKFKDNEAVKLKHKWIYLSGAIFVSFMAVIDMLFFKWDWQDPFNLGLGLFIIWGVQFNGLYRIMRKIAVWRLKRRDNKFDYFHT